MDDKARVIRDRIRGNFDRGAAAYRRFEEQRGFFGKLLRELLAMAPDLEGARVLDVGCGTGASLDVLRGTVGVTGELWGIDVSLEMLKQAREAVGSEVKLAVMDGCHYGAGFRQPFDAVVYNAVLFLLPDAAASLASAAEVLRPGGVVLLSHLDRVHLPERGCTVPDYLAARGFSVGRHALSPWPRIAEAAVHALGRPEIRELTLDIGPEGFAAFYGLEPMSAGLLPKLPYADRRRVVLEVADEFAREGVTVEQVWYLSGIEKGGKPGLSAS